MEHTSESVLTGYLSAKDAAKELHVHPFTLRRWRKASYGPKPVRVGGRLYYTRADIRSWLASLGSNPAKAG